jgi:MoaA/NifB/PqqE/SkfB family radical SAM enzyme
MNGWFDIRHIGKMQLEITNFCNAACPLCVREDLHSSDL